jgi:hypothetical protein
MAKRAGFPQNLYVEGFDLSGDIGAIDDASLMLGLLDATGLDKSANERMAGLSDGKISFKSYMNPSAGQAHPVLSDMPQTDVGVLWTLGVSGPSGTTRGSPAFFCDGKQVDYSLSRGSDGSLKGSVEVVTSTGFGMEWAEMLTAGKQVVATPTNHASHDFAVTSPNGLVGYFMSFAYNAGAPTLAVQDSSDNAAFTTRASFVPTAQQQSARVPFAGTVQRYVRGASTALGGSSSITYAIAFRRRYAAEEF